MDKPLKIMVLAGGPDRERPVSLISGQQITEALEQCGHAVLQRDVLPDDLSALNEFQEWKGDALFLAMHGPWGEGGQLQRLLDDRNLPYFGCGPDAASLCMDKHATKARLLDHGIPTPEFEVVTPGRPLTLPAPVVLKPLREGSSIGIAICQDDAAARDRAEELTSQYGDLLVERFVTGKEMTVGIIGGPGGDEPLPPLWIKPATAFYDYEAKYTREDTQYVFDALPAEVLRRLQNLALEAHRACGCRHLSRVDFMIDAQHRPYVLEINTIPGFTSHSLLPKAAAHAGIDFPALCDRLARLALRASAAR